MSNHRRACVTHQKKIFHQLHLKSLSLKNNNNNISPTNNKITHANNLFSAWNTLQKKRVYSKRLGIEYTFKYQANGSKNVLLHGNHFMYRKRLDNFKHNYSHNPRMRKRQETRFKRHCRRIFRTNKSNPITSLDDRLVAGKRYHFLFLQSQFVNKPIKHLKYNKKSYLPNPQDYKFRVPFFSFSSSTRGRIICNVVENTSTIDDSATGSLSTVPETDTNLESSATSSFLTVNNFDPLPSTVTIPYV
ncbi:unnamed protein product [Rhizophagus irregularis]|uniref:DUF8211 domain-containing protein n=1 Tax=Rhizophagus irregularis TaxID=588596 RepID=A0A915ZGH1_9GLOM|nr:unnamed protein product [Rhizophagus irregularis]